MPDTSIVFSGEFTAIAQATAIYPRFLAPKYIATDAYTQSIQKLLVENHSNIKVIWIAGHKGINRKVLDGRTAKETLFRPLIILVI